MSLPPALTLLPVTLSNAPRKARQRGWHAASFCLAILDSIGEANCLAISDPLIAMTVLHGTMTGAEVNALRQPLKKKLSAVSDLPSHIVAFRGVLAWLATAGQAPIELDAFRLFLTTLSPFPL